MSPTRFWLGMMQMFVATIGLGLLLTTGISIATLAVTLLATVLTLLSRRLSQQVPPEVP
jgi:hypothetical protein